MHRVTVEYFAPDLQNITDLIVLIHRILEIRDDNRVASLDVGRVIELDTIETEIGLYTVAGLICDKEYFAKAYQCSFESLIVAFEITEANIDLREGYPEVKFSLIILDRIVYLSFNVGEFDHLFVSCDLYRVVKVAARVQSVLPPWNNLAVIQLK